MDFTFDEDQVALADLAAQIFGGHGDVDRIKEIERGDERVDRDLWKELAKSNLLAISLPESAGGSGLGVVETCLVLEQQGRYVTPVPRWPTITAALAIAAFGTPAAQAVLADVVDGDAILAVALGEEGTGNPLGPSVTATATDEGWSLSGVKVAVPVASLAARIVVTARLAEGGLGAFVVDPSAAGVTVEVGEGTNRELDARVVFDGVAVRTDDALGDCVQWIVDRALVFLCAIQVGVSAEAVRLAADYTSNREQFGRPLSTNQGVAMEVADAHIATESLRVTLWQAAWRLDNDLDASQEALVAKWWASSGGRRALHLTQHVHGGMGVDVDFPFHRYFLWAKQIEVALGGPSQQLAWLGAKIAAQS